MSQMIALPLGLVTETDPDGNIIVTVDAGGTFYRIPLAGLTPDFEPVNPDDAIVGPVVFTPAMEATFTKMEKAGAAGPDIFGFQAFEDAVLLCFYRQVYGLTEGQTLRFADANRGAIVSGGNYPAIAVDVIPAARYRWEKAAAAAWHLLKQQLGQ